MQSTRGRHVNPLLVFFIIIIPEVAFPQQKNMFPLFNVWEIEMRK